MGYVELRRAFAGIRNPFAGWDAMIAKILRIRYPGHEDKLSELRSVVSMAAFAFVVDLVMLASCLYVQLWEGVVFFGALDVWTLIYLLALFAGLFSLETFFQLFVFTSLASFYVAIQLTGGFSSPFLPWMVLPPTAAFLLIGRKGLWTWTFLTSLSLGSMVVVEGKMIPLVEEYLDLVGLFSALGLGGAQLLSIGLLIRTRQQLLRSRYELDLEMKVQQDLLTALEQGQMDERERIAWRLRDRLGPLFDQAAAHQERYLLQVDDPLARQELTRQFNLLTEDLGRISRALGRSGRSQESLQGAIHDLAHNLRLGTGLEVHLDLPESPALPMDATNLHIYRIVQEAFRNVVRHAEAHQVWLSMRLKGSSIQFFSIEDDGKGLAVQAAFQPGQGLQNILDRIALLNGESSLGRGSKGGTRWEFRFTQSFREEEK